MKSVTLKVNATAQIQAVATAIGAELPEKFQFIKEVTYSNWPETIEELRSCLGDTWLVERVPSFYAYHIGHGSERAATEAELIDTLGLKEIKKDKEGNYPADHSETAREGFVKALAVLSTSSVIEIVAPTTGPTERQLDAAKAALSRKAEMEEAGRELMAALAANDPVALASATKKLEKLRRVQTSESEAETAEHEAEPTPAPKRNKK